MRVQPLLLIMVAACTGKTIESHARGPDLSWVPRYFREFDSVAAIAEMPALRTDSAPGQEIRVWYLRGLITPQAILRLRGTGNDVTGQYFLWWPLAPSDREWSTQVDEDVRRWYRCGSAEDIGGLRVCEVKTQWSTPWADVLHQLATDQLMTLPDESQLEQPDNVIFIDCDVVVVEVREHQHYRTYHYSCPAGRGSPEAAHAAGILSLMDQLLDEARNPP
jgi:hypothetical protein